MTILKVLTLWILLSIQVASALANPLPPTPELRTYSVTDMVEYLKTAALPADRKWVAEPALLLAEFYRDVFGGREFRAEAWRSSESVFLSTTIAETVYPMVHAVNEKEVSVEQKQVIRSFLPRIDEQLSGLARRRLDGVFLYLKAWCLYQTDEKEESKRLFLKLFEDSFRKAVEETQGRAGGQSLIASNDRILRILRRMTAPEEMQQLQSKLEKMRSIDYPPN